MQVTDLKFTPTLPETPLGKIILLSLPSPNEDTMKKLDNMFKNFKWNNKPAKFRKEIMETTVEHGGLENKYL